MAETFDEATCKRGDYRRRVDRGIDRVGAAPAESGRKRHRHRPPASEPADCPPRRGRHPYHDRPRQRGGRGRVGDRLHARRADRRPRARGRQALPGGYADHRRRQHEADESSRRWTISCRGAAASWAAIRWPAAKKLGPITATADLFEGRVAILTPTKNTRAEDFDLLGEVSGRGWARWSCRWRPRSTIGPWP